MNYNEVYFIYFILLILTQGYVFIEFRERGMGRERNIDWLPPVHTLRIEPAA